MFDISSIASGFISARDACLMPERHQTKAIPVPPHRVIEVRSNDTTHKRNVAALARAGGFGCFTVGVKP